MNVDDAVIVALGSNQALGAAAPQEVLEAALARFPALGLELVKRSRWWRSKAWPDPSQPDFLNGVAWVRTALEPEAVMDALLEIEAEFGRVRSEPNAPRTLDLDLISYGRAILGAPPPSQPKASRPSPADLLPLREKVAAERPDEGSESLSGEGSRTPDPDRSERPLTPLLRRDPLPQGERVEHGVGDLTVPHPRAHQRLFVMGPLAEIAPDWRHPATGKSASDLKAAATVGGDARPETRRASLWWRLALLVAAAAALLFALLAPLQSISVKLTLPASESGPATAQDVTPPDWVLWIWQAVIVAVLLLAAAWIAREIMRRRS